jgi:hypothetical protein
MIINDETLRRELKFKKRANTIGMRNMGHSFLKHLWCSVKVWCEKSKDDTKKWNWKQRRPRNLRVPVYSPLKGGAGYCGQFYMKYTQQELEYLIGTCAHNIEIITCWQWSLRLKYVCLKCNSNDNSYLTHYSESFGSEYEVVYFVYLWKCEVAFLTANDLSCSKP